MIVSRTPFRLSLFGGGCDHFEHFKEHNAEILSTTIDKYVNVVIGKRFDNLVRVGYSKTELVENIDDLQHELVREALRRFDLSDGLEITTIADLPGGTGLGSSSAVTVGVLHALHAYFGNTVSSFELAKSAIGIEVKTLNNGSGWQDQIACAYGGLSTITLDKYYPNFSINRLAISQDIIDKLDGSLLMFYTGITRSASEILKDQNNNLQDNLELLQHMTYLARTARLELYLGNVDAIGPMLNDAWETKKKLSNKVTNPQIDELVDYILTNMNRCDKLGVKLNGAGSGGFLTIYCPKESQSELRDLMRIKGIRELPFKFENKGSRIIYQE